MCGNLHTLPNPIAYPIQANVNSIGLPQLPRLASSGGDSCDLSEDDALLLKIAGAVAWTMEALRDLGWIV